MTKQEFVDRVAQRANLSRREAAEAVDAVLDSITEVLSDGDEVKFTGFGKFTIQHRKERQGVNPRNPSEKLTIPAATVPKFSAGSTLKTAVRGNGEAGRAVAGDVTHGTEGAEADALAGDPDVPWDDEER